MPTAPANGITLFYDTFGDAQDPALLLVMGLGAQMIMWDEAFCRSLAASGFHVIRFDNRDTGLSSKIEGGPAPDVAKAMAGDHSTASYTLWDMADDAAGLLDHLGIAKAHIVGASMGGMIVQAMAIRHPDRVLSMCSIMSTTGNGQVGQARPEAMGALFSAPPASRQEAIELAVKTMTALCGTFPLDAAATRERAALAYDRCFYPVGTARQLVGVIAAGDRTEALKQVAAPTLVIHGELDPLIDVSGGRATAEAIPGAELLVIPGMGHDIPADAQAQIVGAIVANTRRAAVTA